MTRATLIRKQLLKSERVAEFGAQLEKEVKTKIFLLDTCYLRRLIDSGYGVYETLKKLSEKGDVIITGQVMRELGRQLKFEKPRDEAVRILGEFYRLFNEGKVQIEKVEVAPEKIKEMSAKMAEISEKGNKRVGEGEASIFEIARMLRGLYDSMHVLSQDSDVSVLKKALRFEEMQVAEAYAL